MTSKWGQKCSKIALLNRLLRKLWDEVELFGSQNKMAELSRNMHFTCFMAKYCLKTSQEQQEDNLTELEYIWRPEQTLSIKLHYG